MVGDFLYGDTNIAVLLLMVAALNATVLIFVIRKLWSPEN
jgi:uncharacterized membrane protein